MGGVFMKLKYSTSGLLLVVLGVMFSTAQASHKYYPKEDCGYDLREGLFTSMQTILHLMAMVMPCKMSC